MLPYFEVGIVPVLGISYFWVFTGLGLFLGYVWGVKRGKEYGVSQEIPTQLMYWMFFPGVIGSHLFDVLLYTPARLSQGTFSALLDIGNGMSSFGAILTGCLGGWLYLRFRKEQIDWRILLDMVAQGLVVGLLVGRIGCALIHDHLGAATDFFLAVNFPQGPRHDLAVYEVLFLLLVLFPVTVLVHRRKPCAGTQAIVFFWGYSPVRFFFETLRVNDARYFGWTPAQYGCVLFMYWGLLLYLQFYSEKGKAFIDASRAGALSLTGLFTSPILSGVAFTGLVLLMRLVIT